MTWREKRRPRAGLSLSPRPLGAFVSSFHEVMNG